MRFQVEPFIIWYTGNRMAIKIIIAITGLIGAGKSTVAEFLEHDHRFLRLSFRSYLGHILEQRGLPLEREHMRVLANEIRALYGSDYILKEMLRMANDYQGNVVIESIRTVNEVKYLHEIGAVLVAVTAPSYARYERVIERGSSTDSVTYDEFLTAELRESQSIDDDVQNLTAVLNYANYVIENIDRQETRSKITEILAEISKI